MRLLDFEVGKKYTLLNDKNELAWEDEEYIYLTPEGYYKDENNEFMSLAKWILTEDNFIEKI